MLAPAGPQGRLFIASAGDWWSQRAFAFVKIPLRCTARLDAAKQSSPPLTIFSRVTHDPLDSLSLFPLLPSLHVTMRCVVIACEGSANDRNRWFC